MKRPGKDLLKTKSKQEKELKVTEGRELLEFLLEGLPGESRNSIKGYLTRGQVLVDNQRTTQYNHPLKQGQLVTILSSTVKSKAQSTNELGILFEDPYLLVVEKPAGLLSIATGKETEETAYNILMDHLKETDRDNRVFVVHRLDRETSGVMMYAKSEAIQKVLQENWKKTVSERSYIAVVEGFVKKERGSVISWLKESKTLKMYSSPTPNGGQKALLDYRVLKRNKSYSLLEITLDTGRKNQIRVQMQDMGHSIIGDKKYGAKTNPIKRLGLHARVLGFTHPVTKEKMSFESEIPIQFLRLFHKN